MVKIFHACTANQSSRPNVVTLKRNKYQTTSPFKTLYILHSKRRQKELKMRFICILNVFEVRQRPKAKMSLLLNLDTLLVLIVNWQLCVKICYFFQWIHEVTNFWDPPTAFFNDFGCLLLQLYITGKTSPSASIARPLGGSSLANEFCSFL